MSAPYKKLPSQQQTKACAPGATDHCHSIHQSKVCNDKGKIGLISERSPSDNKAKNTLQSSDVGRSLERSMKENAGSLIASEECVVAAFLAGKVQESSEEFQSVDIRCYVHDHQYDLKFPEKLLLLLAYVERESRSKADNDATNDIAPARGYSDSSALRCISWAMDGQAFVVSHKENLTKHLLPHFFHQETKFLSFTRKLYRWGFRRINPPRNRKRAAPSANGTPPPAAVVHTEESAAERIVFGHECFDRNRRQLLRHMKSTTAESLRNAANRKEQFVRLKKRRNQDSLAASVLKQSVSLDSCKRIVHDSSDHQLDDKSLAAAALCHRNRTLAELEAVLEFPSSTNLAASLLPSHSTKPSTAEVLSASYYQALLLQRLSRGYQAIAPLASSLLLSKPYKRGRPVVLPSSQAAPGVSSVDVRLPPTRTTREASLRLAALMRNEGRGGAEIPLHVLAHCMDYHPPFDSLFLRTFCAEREQFLQRLQHIHREQEQQQQQPRASQRRHQFSK